MRMIASFASASSMIAAAAAASQVAAPFTPTGKWTVNYADNMCVLERSYGTRERPLILGFKPTPMGDGLRLVVLSDRLGAAGRSGKADIRTNQAQSAEGRFVTVRTPDKAFLITVIDLKRSELGLTDEATTLTIKAGADLDATFALDRVGMAMKGLDDCATDLLKHWGMEESVLASIVSPPAFRGNPASYVRPGDYPDAAIRRGEQGSSGVRFMVGIDGTARDCKVVEPSGSELLDETTCRVITSRARFTPAMNRDGKPVPSLSYTRITWSMPDG